MIMLLLKFTLGNYLCNKCVPRCQLGTVMMLKVGVETIFE